MSVRVMTWVWDTSHSQGRALLVELALADHSNDEGISWPSVATLAQKARCTERQVQRTIKSLLQQGRLEVDESAGPRRTNVYRFLDVRVGEIMSPRRRGAEKGDKTDPPGGAVVSPDPSKDPSKDPSAEQIRARDKKLQLLLHDWHLYGQIELADRRRFERLVEGHGYESVAYVVGEGMNRTFPQGPPSFRWVEGFLDRIKRGGGLDVERAAQEARRAEREQERQAQQAGKARRPAARRPVDPDDAAYYARLSR